jgi:hypothetical protein
MLRGLVLTALGIRHHVRVGPLRESGTRAGRRLILGIKRIPHTASSSFF